MKPVNRCKNILLAIDGSAHSNAALNILLDLELEPDCSITIVSALDTPHTPRRQILLAALEHSERKLSSAGYKVKKGILHGHPAQAILEYSEEHKPDLILLGAKGLRATLGILLGGIAQQLIEYSQFPVLVVRSQFDELKRVLIAIDGSEYSQHAMNFVVRLPIKKTADFYLVHVTPSTAPVDIDVIAQTWPIGAEIVYPVEIEDPEAINRSLEEERQRGERLLNEAAGFFHKNGIEVKKSQLQGDAATEILEYSKANEIDLIVAGSRGLSQVQGWLLGSVSRKLVHYANCSVLIVK